MARACPSGTPSAFTYSRRQPEKTPFYQVPIRQWVFTLPHPLRYPLAFDGQHLGRVLRIFTDTVAAWYRRHHQEGKTGAFTVLQRASSDLRLNPYFHTLFLDGVYLHGPEGETPIFQAASRPTQEDTAPGDGVVNARIDESLGEADPVLARLFSAATVGVAPAGPALRRAPIRLVQGADAGPESKSHLCAQDAAFNLQAARRVTANDRLGREMLCRYILRPPLANERLHHMEDGTVTLEFSGLVLYRHHKKPI